MKKPNKSIQRVGVIGNSEKASLSTAVREAAKLVASARRELFSDETTARLAGVQATRCKDAASLAREVDLLLVFGGDGTLLKVARDIAGSRTPMLGINIGSLGFLTGVPMRAIAKALQHVWNGDFTYGSLPLLEAKGTCTGCDVTQSAVNDIVINRGISSRLIELEVRIDRVPLTRYRCDGLIISSPTGSTAYSLAAGGAIVAPTAAVMEITPICPHTLSNRSLIVPLTSRIEVRVASPRPSTILSADGQIVSHLAEGDVITVTRSRRTVRLMHLANTSFWETLRLKLHWRGATM